MGGGDLLIGDLLSLDYPAPTPAAQPVNNNANQQQPVADLLGDIFGGMDVSVSCFRSEVINVKSSSIIQAIRRLKM